MHKINDPKTQKLGKVHVGFRPHLDGYHIAEKIVGWVERSETQHKKNGLYPTYIRANLSGKQKGPFYWL